MATILERQAGECDPYDMQILQVEMAGEYLMKHKSVHLEFADLPFLRRLNQDAGKLPVGMARQQIENELLALLLDFRMAEKAVEIVQENESI